MKRASASLSSFFDRVLDWIYPSKCPLCSVLSDVQPCEQCRSECQRHSGSARYDPGSPLDFRASVYRYTGRAGQAVRRLKYNRSTALVDWMSNELVEEIERLAVSGEIIVPVPIHWSRRCQRGFNQSELLCREMRHHAYEPACLKRIRRTKPQVGLTVDARLQNLRGAFQASSMVQGRSVILVDDVITSGGTALECARALKGAGAVNVGILTFAGED